MSSSPGFRGRPRDGSRLPEDEAYWTELQRTVVEQGRPFLAAYDDSGLVGGGSSGEREPWTAPAWAVSALAVTAAAAALLILVLPPRSSGLPASGSPPSEAIWSRSLAPGDPLGESLIGPEPPPLYELAIGAPGEVKP